MSSAEDVQSDAATEPPDERLARAFDRAARLGIDIDRDEGLSEREAAAVRAFAALDLDAAETEAGVPAWETAAESEAGVPAWEAAVETEAGVPASEAAVESDAGVPAWEPPAWDVAGPVVSGPHAPDPMGPEAPRAVPTDGGPAPDRAMTRPAPVPPVDGGPLRPDAVWHVRAYADSGPTAGGTRRDAPAIVLDVPETPVATATPAPPVGTAGEVDAAATPRTIDQYLLDLLAVAIATGAFVTPWAWMFVVAVGATVGVTLRSITDHGDGPAALFARAARRALGWVHLRSLVVFPLIVVRTVVLAAALPGVVLAIWWAVDQGTDGTFVAARTAVWGHAPRTGAAILCYMLVAGIGDARHRRAALVGRATGVLGPRLVVALAGMTVVTAAVVLTLVPRADGGRLAAHDGLGWAPPGVRSGIDHLRDDVVTRELQATANCLSDRQGLRWTVDYTGGNPLDDDDIARLVADDRIPAPSEQATAVAAVHNQLAPWVEGIELAAGDSVIVRLDRALLPSGRPVVEPAPLVEAAVNGAEVLAGGAGGFERDEALRCASATIP